MTARERKYHAKKKSRRNSVRLDGLLVDWNFPNTVQDYLELNAKMMANVYHAFGLNPESTIDFKPSTPESFDGGKMPKYWIDEAATQLNLLYGKK